MAVVPAGGQAVQKVLLAVVEGLGGGAGLVQAGLRIVQHALDIAQAGLQLGPLGQQAAEFLADLVAPRPGGPFAC